MIGPMRAMALNDFEAEVCHGFGGRMAFNTLEQDIGGDPADLISWNADRGQGRDDLGSQLDVVEAGNGQIIRHPDTATLALKQCADSENIVGKEYGFDVGRTGAQFMEAVGSGLERECRFALETGITWQAEITDGATVA